MNEDSYDYVVCGAGVAGSVVARRLAENPARTVLLLEAGRDETAEQVRRPEAWLSNLASPRDWGTPARPSGSLNGRAPLLSMGKGVGGGSSINAMIWSHGHRSDWDGYSEAVGDPSWSYEVALATFRRVEDWHGAPDPLRRGEGGLVFVQPAPGSVPLASAVLDACRDAGIPAYDDANGEMMEGHGGAALTNLLVRDGRRVTIYDAYVRPFLDRPNLTVLTGALVSRIVMDKGAAVGVEFVHSGEVRSVRASAEIVLSLGAFHTPKVLMLSGIGDEVELRRHDIAVVRHLPGVGRNLQDHVLLRGCNWASPEPVPFTNNGAEASFFWRSDDGLSSPDVHALLVSAPVATPEVKAAFGAALPPGWSLLPALLRPRSTGRVRLSGASPTDPVDVDWGMLDDPGDMRALVAAVELARSVGNGAGMRAFRTAETLPGMAGRQEREEFVRNAAASYWHQSCTARMGLDDLAVVDAGLRVHGVDRLRVADASVFPWIPTGNTMAPTVVVAERAAALMLER